jgi:hypothetical protein
MSLAYIKTLEESKILHNRVIFCTESRMENLIKLGKVRTYLEAQTTRTNSGFQVPEYIKMLIFIGSADVSSMFESNIAWWIQRI